MPSGEPGRIAALESTARLSLVVRDAAPHERQAALEATLAAYAEYEHQLSPAFWSMYRPNIEETMREETLAQRLVAVDGDTVIGSVLYYPPHAKPARPGRPSQGWPEVRLLAVAPHERGRGIARILMNECLRRARAASAPVLQLHTMAAMQIAREMYERMGFIRAPQLDFEPIDGIDVYGYTLNLREGGGAAGS